MLRLAAFISWLAATRAEPPETLHCLNSIRAFPATPQWLVWFFKLWKTTAAIQILFKQNRQTGLEFYFPIIFLNSYALPFAGVDIIGAVRSR